METLIILLIILIVLGPAAMLFGADSRRLDDGGILPWGLRPRH